MGGISRISRLLYVLTRRGSQGHHNDGAAESWGGQQQQQQQQQQYPGLFSPSDAVTPNLSKAFLYRPCRRWLLCLAVLKPGANHSALLGHPSAI